MGLTRSEIITTKGELIWEPESLLGPASPTTEKRLGFTDTGVELEYGDFTFLDVNEESGREPGVAFFAGQDVRITAVLRQWNAEVLEVRFPDQYDVAADRIELPGDLVVGDSMLAHAGRLLLRAENPTKDPYVLAMKAVLIASAPVEFGPLKIRKTSVTFQLYPDETLVGQAQEKYRTLAIAKTAGITFP